MLGTNLEQCTKITKLPNGTKPQLGTYPKEIREKGPINTKIFTAFLSIIVKTSETKGVPPYCRTAKQNVVTECDGSLLHHKN